jgi:hypothetical protein
LTRSFLLKLSARKKTKVQGLLDGHPLLADVVVLGTREALNAVEAPPYPLESFLLDVMVQKLATDAMFPRLRW